MTHKTRIVDVASIARVEGEGALHVKVRDGEIVDLRLEIYEPPRFFEAFLRGRRYDEVPDIVPRICGICPVAYQMSAIYGIEEMMGIEVDPVIHDLRRMLYLAEWIESHMLHVHLLAAPDFLGFESAIEMAKADPVPVERGLVLKRLGNDIMAVIGGREIHPVSPRVGGFSKVPDRDALLPFLERLDAAEEDMRAVARWVADFPLSALDRETELVSLVHPDEYPVNRGRVTSTEGRDFPMADFETQVDEFQVTHSTALHARFSDGASYIVGPLARVSLNAERLSANAVAAMGVMGLRPPEKNMFFSAAARVTETTHAVDELRLLIERYVRPDTACLAADPKPGIARWITEAPRGMLYHRYEIDGEGMIREAKIIPPTSQNLRHMELDLRIFIPTILDRTDEELVRLCEEVVRNYDPCISCSTHFLRLEMDRG